MTAAADVNYDTVTADNLRNVAIPGTGIPLSAMCRFKAVAVAFLLLGYPLVALVAALNLHKRCVAKVATAYSDQLLNPQDWFSFWQLNCRLATHHPPARSRVDPCPLAPPQERASPSRIFFASAVTPGDLCADAAAVEVRSSRAHQYPRPRALAQP